MRVSPLYETQDDIVYAGEGALLVHAPYTGQRTITLPRRATVYDVMERPDHRCRHALVPGVPARPDDPPVPVGRRAMPSWRRPACPCRRRARSRSPVPEPPALGGSHHLPPPPDIPSPIAPPLSELAAEIAARYEREHQEQEGVARTNGAGPAAAVSLEVSDLTAVLEMPEGEGD